MSALSYLAFPMNRLNLMLSCLMLFAPGFEQPTAQVATTITGQRVDIDLYGNIYILNPDRSTLKLYTKDRILLREIGGSGWENDQFDRPAGMWARNGIDVFVADYGNHRIQRFDRKLNYVSTLYTRESQRPEERFGYPGDVAVSRLGDPFVCDTENSRIVKVNRFTQVERTFGGFGAGEGRLSSPTQVEAGPKDHIYVVDGVRVLVFDNFGNYLRDLPGEFRQPLSLYANDESVLVADSTTFYWFDGEERPVNFLPMNTIAGMNDVRSVAFTPDSMFVLSGTGLFAWPNPNNMMQMK